MPNLNRVLLIGNLTRDPQVRYTPKGTPLADIGLATNRSVPSTDGGDRREEVTFVDVVLWGKLAETAEKYLQKGKPVFVEGYLKLDSWDDKQTGQRRSRLRVVAETLQMLGGRPAEQKPTPTQPVAPTKQPAPVKKATPAAPADEPPDDIPF
jgi:single-strand DNA-binding protein